uniref:RBR-type E3 ubiquitin transferase n=1 Tax=Paramormyrops kingsleyae TaxID=1676925 RepID=A0A3B3QTA8_9TELE
MSEDQEAQEDELLALASIYNEEEFRRSESTQGGEIQLCLELAKDFKIYLKGGKQTEYAVSFLPPLVLNFELPLDYPSTSAPAFTLSSKWLSRAQVKLLVGEELFARYDRLLLQSSLDLMADVVYCPRKMCHSAVMTEPNATMGICPSCQFAFCVLCKRAYHGVSECQTTAEELQSLREDYLSASAEGKRFLEQRYGKMVIQRAIEESFSREWLDQNCKGCPRCGTNIQKIDGCNKMTCTSCKQYFCWLCLSLLTHGNPYSHFNNTASPCYNRLFQGVNMNDEGDVWSDEED